MAAVNPSERKNLLVPGLERWPLDESKPVLQLVDVSVAFGDNVVLDGLSLDIVPGKTTVIVGRSGSGKSVLLKLMMGLLRPSSGKVIAFGRDLATVSPVEIIALRKRMSMLFQNYALFDSLPVEDNAGFSLLVNTEMRRRDVMELSHHLLEILGLSGSEHLLPSELSGGMRKRVSLARALIPNPEVVLFDEPTTGLDPIMIEKVDEMILMARQQYQITSVIISHDMASTKRLADRVAFLHGGKIITVGTYDEFIHSELEPVRVFVEGSRTSRLERGPEPGPETVVDDEATTVVQPALGEPVVELVGVRKSFAAKEVLKGVDLAIRPGRITVLIGGSGSGKSVIIKHIMGLFKADKGEVRVFGQDITPLGIDDLNEVRRRFGMLFQHAALLDWLTVSGNVAFPLEERTKLSKKEIHDQVLDILERLHIADIKDRLPGEISEGQKKRVGLARAIIMKPEIMIYDEPTTGQDPIRTREVDDMIVETQEQFDITSIVISHDMASTFRIAHTIALVNSGVIAAYGSPPEIRSSADPYVQHFIHAGSV
jgi:ABC-type transporter Mla maintaining outer membrane lipid asymmetry ATPase subunit MlaF